MKVQIEHTIVDEIDEVTVVTSYTGGKASALVVMPRKDQDDKIQSKEEGKAIVRFLMSKIPKSVYDEVVSQLEIGGQC